MGANSKSSWMEDFIPRTLSLGIANPKSRYTYFKINELYINLHGQYLIFCIKQIKDWWWLIDYIEILQVLPENKPKQDRMLVWKKDKMHGEEQADILKIVCLQVRHAGEVGCIS